MVSFEKESSIMEPKISNRENLQAFTIKELNSLMHNSLIEKDLPRALEIGKRLEAKHFQNNEEEMVDRTRELNLYLRIIKQWPTEILHESRSTALSHINHWFVHKLSNYHDYNKEFRRMIFEWLLTLEEGDIHYVNKNRFQILQEISQIRERMLVLRDHPLFHEFKFEKYFQYIPKFALDETAHEIEIEKSPFFDSLGPVDKLLIRLNRLQDKKKKFQKIYLDQLSKDLQGLKGIFFEENESSGEIELTQKGKIYAENVIKVFLKQAVYRPFPIESKFISFIELMQVVVKMCFLPPGMGVSEPTLLPSNPEEIIDEDVKYLLLLLSVEYPSPLGKMRYAEENNIDNKDRIEEFLQLLKKWHFPIPSFEIIPRNSIRLTKNRWFDHYCPYFQYFLKLENIDEKRSLVAEIMERNPEKKYQSQQNMLYDDNFYRKLTHEGNKFLLHFEGIFLEKVLFSHLDEKEFNSSLIISLSSEINNIFKQSLEDINYFFKIVDDSSKIVTINEYLDIRYVNKQTLIYVNGKKFSHCKYILLVNPQDLYNQHQINSIDEAQQFLDASLHGVRMTPIDLGISPEDEFWAHCSNLQCWVENNYDTRILHSNLSFPLLSTLAQHDSMAKLRLQEEIVIRISKRYYPVLCYLMEEKYYKYLDIDQLMLLSEVLEDIYSETRYDPSIANRNMNVKNFINELKSHMLSYPFRDWNV